MIIFDRLEVTYQDRLLLQWQYPYPATVDAAATRRRIEALRTPEEQETGTVTYPGELRWGDIGTNNAREMSFYLWLFKSMMKEEYLVHDTAS